MVSIVPVDETNWKAVCRLSVEEAQLPFVCHFSPPAAEALSVAFVRPGGFEIRPFAIECDGTVVGFFVLCAAETIEEIWLKFFFVDRARQGRGIAKAALELLDRVARPNFPDTRRILLTVHPDNRRAAELCERAGFERSEREYLGHPIWTRRIGSDKLEP